MPKKPTIVEQLKSQVQVQASELEDIRKKLEQETGAKKHYYEANAAALAEIEQVHQFLDAVPFTIPRESAGEHSWDRVKRSVSTRLAAWLAWTASAAQVRAAGEGK